MPHSLPFIISDGEKPILRLNENLVFDVDWASIEKFVRDVYRRKAINPIAEVSKEEAMLVAFWIAKHGVARL
jgi:hypothetical protein